MHAAPFNAILWRLSWTLISSSLSSSPFVSLRKNTPFNTPPLNEARFLLLFPEYGKAQFGFAVYVSSFLDSNLFAFLFSCIGALNMCSCFFRFFFMFRVQNESPVRVLNADMFATPPLTFELPSYPAKLAYHLAETPSPPPSCTCPFNKVVLDFLDIEAKHGKDSDRHGSPSC